MDRQELAYRLAWFRREADCAATNQEDFRMNENSADDALKEALAALTAAAVRSDRSEWLAALRACVQRARTNLDIAALRVKVAEKRYDMTMDAMLSIESMISIQDGEYVAVIDAATPAATVPDNPA